ncbi:MAG: Eco57I restriction-modification methylase domain-containing protein [Methanothrix sp.]|nr:Eco57I restriction-modification methylase domain-containing protein [Methanothrix sp.]
MAAPKEIVDLVAEFERDQSFYKSAQFNETELRTRFINPLIAALGWDVYHDRPCRADQHEVKEEDSVEVEGKIKNPDYSFRLFDSSLGSMKRKFFIEVKRPSVNIEAGAYPAFQLRRYAWSADLPISILTDFEEFSVYYCLSRPGREDKPTKSRIMYLRYDQYAEKWEEIAALFSREAVLNGSLDRYARSLPQKRGEKRVDAALLGDISRWREALAKNIALRNPELDTASLNYSVQAIIDRIMFLRICEDRGIERYMRLKHLLEGVRVYARLFELFQQADERYNSGIFHFHKEPGRENPDIITPNLKIDDGTLKEIIKQLYFPESPYAFSVLPAEILGQIYEQFLGQVIRLDQDHLAVVEDKPEVKKAGGVKYTPAYIVEAIVQKTLGPTLQGRTARQASEISVLDPACGSGSFLIVAYQFLLDWHRDWFVQHLLPLMERGCKPSSPEIRRLLPETEVGRRGRKRKAESPIYQARDGEWRLTTAERKRILLSNIYGVDIDRQAVEVTKLSLLLKVLEGENEETISKQLTLFQERALPDLGENIKCGNSLIGWDILEDNPGLGQEEIERINPFDWEREFGEVFRRGGFDVVIGNPPYIRMESFKELKDYLRKEYSVHGSRSDLYAYFVERSHNLLQEDGLFSMILSNKFIKANYGAPLRKFLYSKAAIKEIDDFAGLNVFQGVTVRTVILSTMRTDSEFKRDIRTRYLPPPDVETFNQLINRSTTISDIIEKESIEIPIGSLEPERWLLIDELQQQILEKMNYKTYPLDHFVQGRILWGVKTGLNEAFIIDSDTRLKIVERDPKESEAIKPILFGEDVRRYSLEPGDRYLIYTYHGFDISQYPAIEEHLKPYKSELEKRATKQAWYEHQQPSIALVPIFESKKIIYPEIARTCQFTMDDNGYFSNNKTFILPTDDSFILGILNSKLALFYFSIFCAALEGSSDNYLEFRAQYLRGFPIRVIDPSESNEVSRRDRVVSLVEQMLSLHKQLLLARTPHEQTALERQIEATDRQIDALVYELYGLTEEEIGIVEGRG